MVKNRSLLAAAALTFGVVLFSGGANNTPDWSEQTHSDKVKPNFDVVFTPKEVLRVDITISPEDWAAMWADLDANVGNRGRGMQGGRGEGMPGGDSLRGGMMGGREGGMPNRDSMIAGRGGMQGGMQGGMPNRDSMMAGRGGEMGGRGGMMGGGGDPASSLNNYTPLWVPCTITCNGKEWSQVGVRFKGNSSLMSAVGMNTSKLSMKLDFDQYEDEYPELKNQRFYGFKQLNLNNSFNDNSFMREKLTSDLFRDFGLAAAHTRFCIVYIDYDGTGSKLAGLYTLVEEVDDTVIKTQFSDGSGNVYKPESPAGSFAEGSYNPDGFYLKTNKKSADYSDVKALYDILNSSERTTNEAAWKKKLESVFDVDVFLKWFAANNAIQNWDSYGSMAHNYYLYNNPANNLLTWIPWDHNESLQQGKGRSMGDLSSLTRMGNSWPLITYLLSVDEYKKKFDGYLADFVNKVFIPSKMDKICDSYYKILKAYADDEIANSRPNGGNANGRNNPNGGNANGGGGSNPNRGNANANNGGNVRGGGFNDNTAAGFEGYVEAIKRHILSRNEVVKSYLKQ